MFLGAWRVWSHYAWRSARTLPVIRTVAFLQQWTKAEAPPRTMNEVLWEDHVGANRWYTEKFLSVSSILRFHDESDADDSGHGVVPESGSRPRRSGRSALPATTFSGYPWPSSSTVQRDIEVPPPLGNRSVTSSDYQSPLIGCKRSGNVCFEDTTTPFCEKRSPRSPSSRISSDNRQRVG